MTNPYISAARTLAASFEGLEWKERVSWAFTRIRLFERIDAELRRELEGFARGAVRAEAPLATLARMRRALDQLEAEVEAIGKARDDA